MSATPVALLPQPTPEPQGGRRPVPTPTPESRWRPWPSCKRLSLLVLALPLAACVVAPPHGGRHARSAPPPAPVAARPASPMYFYPLRQQTEAQQDRDRYECYRWAVRESGVDPGMTPVRQVAAARPSPSAPPRERAGGGGEVLAGAAIGAAAGAVVSSPRHAAENAVLGAIFGAVVGSAVQAQREREVSSRREPAYTAASPAPAPAVPDHFRRAMGACMDGRGYRVG